jgi:hypothetical protein
MKDITLITASYNTPRVTANMLKSFRWVANNTPVLICDNSTNQETAANLNQHFKIPFFKNPNGLHGPSVDLLLDRVDTKYALLVDTDVIFLRSFEPAFTQVKESDLTLAGELCGDRGGKKLHPRIVPWFCFINVENIKQHNIKFFDKARMELQEDIRYDVGSTFFEDIKQAKLGIGSISGENYYYRHYEGMSWRLQKYGSTDGNIDLDPNATHTNSHLRDYGAIVAEQYIADTKCFDSIPLDL